LINQTPKGAAPPLDKGRPSANQFVPTDKGSPTRLLKRGIVGTWHKVSAKHLPAYLDEMCFRFNNRKNDFLFRDTLIKLILSPYC
jgi:hypothetical protein